MVTNAKPRYWSGGIASRDDFRDPITDEFIDGRTRAGPWAIMTPESWQRHGLNGGFNPDTLEVWKAKLGPGTGQRYRKQADGRWLKVEG